VGSVLAEMYNDTERHESMPSRAVALAAASALGPAEPLTAAALLSVATYRAPAAPTRKQVNAQVVPLVLAGLAASDISRTAERRWNERRKGKKKRSRRNAIS
jgi:hypothetical protein